jgi:hypothetical protein
MILSGMGNSIMAAAMFVVGVGVICEGMIVLLSNI